MPKTQTRYVCQECANVESRWSGRCPQCGQWNTFIEEVMQSKTGSGGAKKSVKLKPSKLKDVKKETSSLRLDSGIGEFNSVLGGGIVPGSIVLLAGEPGIGKSTLLLQVIDGISSKSKALYVTGEESLSQVKLRADRLGLKFNNFDLAASTDADMVTETIRSGDYDFVIVDSIQTMETAEVSSSAGTISQITNSAQRIQDAAKEQDVAVLMVGHVTKQGNIAGPKILEHLVDVVLYLEGEKFGNFKLLRGVKNRFGSTNELGLFEMKNEGLLAIKNPSEVFLKERQKSSDGSVIFPAIEGSRALLVEVQALVSKSPFGYPKRTAVGFDNNRLNLLIAVLERRAKLNLGTYDVYVNIVGGVKVNEPAADLAVALAIASAYKSIPVVENAVVFGEVGLSGEIRSVGQIEKRLKEAKKLGYGKYIGPDIDNKSKSKINNVQAALKYGLVS